MTLQEWCRKHDLQANTSDNGTYVTIPTTHPATADLYRLSDYAVSTRSGPVVWLVARHNTEQDK